MEVFASKMSNRSALDNKEGKLNRRRELELAEILPNLSQNWSILREMQ